MLNSFYLVIFSLETVAEFRHSHAVSHKVTVRLSDTSTRRHHCQSRATRHRRVCLVLLNRKTTIKTMPPKARAAVAAAAAAPATRRSTRSSQKTAEPIIIIDSSPRPTPKKQKPVPRKITSPPSSPLPLPNVKAASPVLEVAKKVVEMVTQTIEVRVPRPPMRELSRFEREELENAQASSSRSPVMRSSPTPKSKGKASAIVIGDSEDEDDIFDMSRKVAPIIKPRREFNATSWIVH